MQATTHRSSEYPHSPARRHRGRYLRVLFFFARTLLHVLWWDLILRRIGFRRLSRRTAHARYPRVARRFRTLATRLGGIWIKVGQFLSARLDVLPESVTRELAHLQDEVSAEPLAAMRPVLAESFGPEFESLFVWIDREPLASASLGQVHRARLADGSRAVVKIQRPQIRDLIAVDLSALSRVIGWMKRYRALTRRTDLDALLAEFSRTVWEEVDYLAEAENVRRFAAMFSDNPAVRIPRVFTNGTTERVLTLEDVYFIKITEYAAIEAAGLSREQVADRLFRTYLQQIFIEGFFHADPHPGNLFVEPLGDGDWRLVFVDFGMVGRVTPTMKRGLRNLAIAVAMHDLDRLMAAYDAMGIILPGADLARIRQAEAAMFERMWGKSMRELIRSHPQEMRRFVRDFRDLLYEMPFQVPADLLFLGRCVAILSGMCTGLNPDFNLFEGLQPFAEHLLAEEGEGWVSELLDTLATQARALAGLPAKLDSALSRLERGEITFLARPAPKLEAQLNGLNLAIRKLVGAAVFAALLVAGTLLYTGGETAGTGYLIGLALLTILWMVLLLR